MTNEEFLKEALASSSCPAEFEKMYSGFCQYQSIVLEVLREFARICEIHDIHYQLAFGSLIGAVRDNGQIPWDYDVDVCIPFYEREALIKALTIEKNELFDFYTREQNDDYWLPFIRVVPKGYPHAMLHVDVFYVLGIPDEEPDRSAYSVEVFKLYHAYLYLFEKITNTPRPFKWKIKRMVVRILYVMKYGKGNQLDANSVFGRYDIRDTKDAITGGLLLGKYIIPSHVFLNSTTIQTRDGSFKIPKDYEKFLSVRYGNWKQYPPVEDKIAEVIKRCNQFKWYKNHKMVPEDAPDV